MMADRAPVEPLAPGAVIGILGGGQLGRMLAMAAAEFGLTCHVYCPDPESPAFEVAARHTVADYHDSEALAAFGAAVDVVTYEFENVPLDALAALGATPIRPSVRALEVAQDRLTEKAFLDGLGVPVAPFHRVDDLPGLEAALAAIGRPAILKTRRLGYDGKGQVRIGPTDPPAEALAAIGEVPAILEGLVPFSFETSTLVAIGGEGTDAPFDMPENVHRDGILRLSRLPCRVDPATAATAIEHTRRIAAALGYTGLLTVEWFAVPEDAGRHGLVANEIAPRVHNSGHWTQDAAVTSQFEQHIRAIAGWPLGNPARTADVVMENLIGAEVENWHPILAEPAARLHLYGKRTARAGRKMGHVNRLVQALP